MTVAFFVPDAGRFAAYELQCDAAGVIEVRMRVDDQFHILDSEAKGFDVGFDERR